MSRKKMTEDEKKSRITLNINDLLLEKIDKFITDTGDNRSKLIEKLLIEYINNKKG